MSTLVGNALVAQGGGPTVVINQSLAGIVLEARKFANVLRVYGALNGVQGIVDEEFLDMTEATTHNIEAVAKTPSSALLSTRLKPDKEFCKQIFKVCKSHNIRYFFYIGGNDSAETCRIIARRAQATGFAMRVIHVPKTIDNDLKVTDHCPGYPSAAKFVASAFAGVNLDNRSIPGIYIGVVMGRDAGFLTAASALGKKYPDDGPHLIYLPERPFTIDQFVDDVKRVYDKYGRCIVAVSEGIRDPEGVLFAQKLRNKDLEVDAHGNPTLSGSGALGDMLCDLLKKRTKISRIRADTLGYLQRSFLGVHSKIDEFEAREVGEKAVQFALWHSKDGSVCIRRIGDYAVEYFIAPLEDVAKEATCMPTNFINETGNNVTAEFMAYLRPLVGYLPRISRIVAPKVEKIINVKDMDKDIVDDI